MSKKRLLILGVIIVLSLGSLGVVRYLTTGKGIEESEGGYVQNLEETSEDEQSSTKPSEDRQSQTESSESDQNPTKTSESEEESTHVPKYADYSESISTYFDLDIDDMMELDRNVVERAPEFDYQYNEEVLFNIVPGLFSESVRNIQYADPDCYKTLLSVLSQYADDHGKDYSVFEMESYYKSMFVEDGLWGHKVLDTASNETLYIAYASTGFGVVGYLYKVF